MSAHKILKEGSLNKVRSGGWGTNKRWFVLFREVGSSAHSLVYFKNEAARKANFSQPGGVYAVKFIKAVRARDKDDPKNVGVSIYFKSNTPATPASPASPSRPVKTLEETKGDKEVEQPALLDNEAAAVDDKPADKAASKEAVVAEKTFMLLEAETKAEADAWLGALAKAHSEEGTIPQSVLLQEETDKLRENRAKKEKAAEGAAKIEGDLRKLKQTNKLGIGAWQSRYFSLDPEFFSYYKSGKKGEPLGYFPVTQMVCVGTSPLQDNTCFFFRLPAAFSTGDGKYLKTGAPPMSPSGAASDGEDDKKADGKAKDVIILLRCNTTADRDRWIQAFVDLGVKKTVSKDKPEPKSDEKGEGKSETKAEGKPEANPEAKPDATASSSTESTSSSSDSSSSSPALLPVEGD